MKRKINPIVRRAAKGRGDDARRLLKKLAAASVNDLQIALAVGVSWRTLYRWRDGASPRMKAYHALRRLAAKKGIQ